MNKWSVLLSLIGLGIYIFFFPQQPQSTDHVLQNVRNESLPITQATPSATLQPSPTTSLETTSTSVLVTRVVDGDTIEIEGGAKVRYIGINAPESTTKTECFGKEASLANKALVEGKYITLEKDVSETDKFGRLLRYVYLGSDMVNEHLILQGYAQASSYPPDVKYQERFRTAQQTARTKNVGLWKGCENTPAQVSSPTPSGECTIKGNISKSSNEKIYHVQGGKFYTQTVIGDVAGEQYFCTEQEAQTAGWRRSKL